MKFLDTQEAEKFKKQKWQRFCWTPCKQPAQQEKNSSGGGEGKTLFKVQSFSKLNTSNLSLVWTLLFLEFLSFAGAQKFHIGHFSTAHFVQILEISNFLSFGEIWNEILSKYFRDVISKLNIFGLLSNKSVKCSCPVMSTHEHS